MKYNRRIFVFTMIIMLLLISGCSKKVQIKNITSEYNAQVEKQPEIVKAEEIVRVGAPQTRTFENKQLKYVNTMQFHSVGPVDKYQDDEGRIYSFNESGTYIKYSAVKTDESMKASDFVKKNPDKCVSQEQAIKIAEEFARENFSSIFKDYRYLKTVNNGDFDVVFERNCGKDNFLSMGRYVCVVLPNGRILYCGISNPDMYKDFDVSRVKDLSKEDFDAVAQKEFEKEYGEKFISFEAKQYSIEKYQDDYIVKIYCNVTAKSDDGKEYTFSEEVICVVD